MEYNKDKKDLTAFRLKDLRKKYKLSHEKLAEELSKKYFKDDSGGIFKRTGDSPVYDKDIAPTCTISSGVLKNYELSTTSDVAPSRMKAGYGMSISYIAMLADFYDVSVDYLLGLERYPSKDLDVKVISKKTGLSDTSIEYLTSHNNDNDSKIDVLNSLFDSEEFDSILEGMLHLRVDAINKVISEKRNEVFSKDYKQKPMARVNGGTAVLSQIQYYDFMRIQLVDSFRDLLQKLIESPIQSMSTEEIENERKLLVEEWNRSQRVIY